MNIQYQYKKGNAFFLKKMKIQSYFLTIFLGLFFQFQNLQAQAIHDALELYTFVSNDYKFVANSEAKADVLYKILARNFATQEVGMTRTALINTYKENPFIAPFLTDDLGGNKVLEGKTGQRALGALAGAGSGLGMPGATFLMGLTDFLVKRTKQELSIAFFRDFQKIVKESEEMKYLFPVTSQVLIKIDENIYQFKAFWEVLRESFLKDLDDLVRNLDDYVQLSSRVKQPVIKEMMSDFFKVIELFYDKTPPAEVIKYLAKDAYLHTLTPAMDSAKFVPILQSSLEILGVFSASLENKDGNGYWVSPDSIMRLIKQPLAGALYLGLVYEQSKNIKIGDKSFGEHLAGLSGSGNNQKLRNLMSIFKAFLDKAQALERLAQDMRNRQNEQRRNKTTPTDADKELEYDDYFEFTQGICDLIVYAYDFKKEILGSSTKEDSLVNTYLSIIGDINGLALNIRKKQYTSAMINTLFIIEKLLPKDKFTCERQVIMKYGTFIATAVQAKTADEVSNAIAAFALPPGGSAIKKYSKFSIALNAYVGLSAGQEILAGVGAKPFYAVSTPIGVTFNWGFKNYGSIGILASVMDIGALTAFRFQDGNNDVNDFPDVKFENVLAPGGYLVYGIPKYPIAIGIGAQLGPNLKTVTNSSLGLSTTSGWRWGAFIAVDIPMVSIFTTNKHYKQCCKKCTKNYEF